MPTPSTPSLPSSPARAAALRPYLPGLVLALGLALIGAYLLRAYLGAYPAIFADEYLYSKMARLTPLADTAIPSYLYLALYSATSACGTGFLDCARYLNVLFIVGAAPFLYASARQVCARPAALAVALLCTLAPAKIYAAYFMPESMYYFSFAVLTWAALAQRKLPWSLHALLCGATLGAMTLVKVHALFLLPALALFLFYAGWRRQPDGPWLRLALAGAALGAGTALAVKFGLGYLFGGDNGLDLLGSLYGKQATYTAKQEVPLARLLAASLLSVKGHLMMLATVFALPLAAVLLFLMRPAAALREHEARATLIVFTLLMLGTALALSVGYTASIAEWGAREGERLHARYYNFCFPLLVMIGAAGAGGWRSWRATSPRRAPLAWIAAALVGALLFYAYARIATDYRLLLVDAPEIVAFGLGAPGWRTLLLLALQAVVLLAWALERRAGALLLLALFLPAFIINGERTVRPTLREARVASPPDLAGATVRDYLPLAERNALAVAGPDLSAMQRALFHMETPDGQIIVLPEGGMLESGQVPADRRWLLLFDLRRLPEDMTVAFRTDHYALLGRQPPGRLQRGWASLADPLPGPLLAGAEGLSSAEPWGRWSDAKQVRLHFHQPLPRQMKLSLNARAFGPNAGRDVVVSVGAVERRFRVGTAPADRHFRIDSDGTERTITITVPEPVTPTSLGWSADDRTLGIGLSRIEIGAAAD